MKFGDFRRNFGQYRHVPPMLLPLKKKAGKKKKKKEEKGVEEEQEGGDDAGASHSSDVDKDEKVKKRKGVAAAPADPTGSEAAPAEPTETEAAVHNRDAKGRDQYTAPAGKGVMTDVLEGDAQWIAAALAAGGVVLVHCEHGVSRGACSVLAYLIAHHVSRHDIAAVWVAFFSR